MDFDDAVLLLKGGVDGIAEWNKLKQCDEFAVCGEGDDWGDEYIGVNLEGAELMGAKLQFADLRAVSLRGAQLSLAVLNGSNCVGASFTGAKLTGAALTGVNFGGADLKNADLSNSYTAFSIFHETRVEGADFTSACMGRNVLASDWSRVRGLGSVQHVLGPSMLSMECIRSCIRSGEIEYLRGCGVDDADIELLRGTERGAARMCSCMICYSTKNEAFVTRLCSDLRSGGVTCWKWDDDGVIGEGVMEGATAAIQTYDKVLVVLSCASLTSPVVLREMERVFVREDDEGRNILFPIALDRYVFDEWKHYRSVDVIKKLIGDANGADSNYGVYSRLLQRVLRDLKVVDRGAPAERE